MSASERDRLDRLLEAHLDGLLADGARREFEQRLADDAGLRRNLAQQQQIDAALRRAATPPDAEAILTRVRAAEHAGRVVALRRRQRTVVRLRYAAAAMIVLAAGGGGWWGWTVLREEQRPYRSYREQPWRSFETVYRDEVAAGFRADWACKTEREFAATFWGRFGQGLLLAQLPPGVESLGLSYCHSLSPNTTHLLGQVQGQNVIVFVDRRSTDKEQKLAEGSPLHLFRRELGKLVLYELTPLDEPHFLPLFYDPHKPANWYQP